MPELSVPFRDGLLQMTLDEAEALKKELDEAIIPARKQRQDLAPPVIHQCKFIDLIGIRDFLLQIYPKGQATNERAKAIVVILLQLSGYTPGVAEKVRTLKVHCKKCKQSGVTSCGDHPIPHFYSREKDYWIDIHSLKKSAPRILGLPKNQLSDKKRADLELLLANL